MNLTGQVNDIFPGRVHAPPSWILIYSYDHHDNDTGLFNSKKHLQYKANWLVVIEY